VESIGELRAQLRQTEGWRLRAALSNLGRTYRVFIGNHRELREYLEAHRSGPAAAELWRDDRRDEFERFLDEVDRMLHNFVAASATFVDHTRRLWKKHPPASAELDAEYQRRIAETFASSPLAAFVKGLRNFTLHRSLPIARGQLSWSQGMSEPVSRIYLERDDLLKGDWSSRARAYLDSASAEIDLAKVVDEYARLVYEFMDWFGKAWVGSHLAAFDDLKLREQELAAEIRARVGA